MDNRFYDREKVVQKAIELIPHFPEKIQIVVAKGISLLAIAEYGADKKMKSLKSMGSDKVMALHKSQLKRRRYDMLPELHHAVNYLKILSSDERQMVCVKIVQVARCIDHYLEVCETCRIEPETVTVEKFRDTYIDQGPDQAEAYLKIVCEAFLSGLKNSRRLDIQEEIAFQKDSAIRRKHYKIE